MAVVVADDYDAEFVAVDVAAAVDEIQEPVSPGPASRSADDA